MRNITVIAGQAMTEEAKSGGQPTEQNNSKAAGVSRHGDEITSLVVVPTEESATRARLSVR
jgi:hypothetical protein